MVCYAIYDTAGALYCNIRLARAAAYVFHAFGHVLHAIKPDSISVLYSKSHHTQRCGIRKRALNRDLPSTINIVRFIRFHCDSYVLYYGCSSEWNKNRMSRWSLADDGVVCVCVCLRVAAAAAAVWHTDAPICAEHRTFYS